MKLGETVTYPDPEGLSLCGNVPLQSSGFGRRAGSDESMSHISPQSTLAAITLVGGGAGGGEVRARAGCEQGLLYSVDTTTISGAVKSQVAGAEALRVRLWQVLFPLRHQHLLPRGEQCWSKRGRSKCLVRAGMQAVMFPAHLSEFQTTPNLP